MKKLLPICTALSLLLCSLDARDNYDEIGYMTFKYGLSSISEDFSLNEHTFALDFIGEVGHDIKPKIDFSYMNIDKKYKVNSIFQVSINAFKKSDYSYQNIVSYYYGGLGYEVVGNSRPQFDNSAYLQAGVGFEIPISQPSDNLHVVTELRIMQLIGSDDGQDNEVALFIGLRIPISDTFSNYSGGGFSQTSVDTGGVYAELEAQTPVLESPEIEKSISKESRYADSDGDGVRDSMDICEDTPRNTAVTKGGCPIVDNKLYVEKPKHLTDYTPKTASTFKGLPLTRKILNVHFELNSAEVKKGSRVVIKDFVESINRTKFSKITVEGYTDNTGDYDKNLDLSQRRAQSVREIMIQYGIDSKTINSIGKGELSPISTNETAIGRAQNRRIEILVE